MNKVIKIDLGRIFKAILSNWYIMAIVGLIIGGIMFNWRSTKKQQYYAAVSLYSAAYGSVSESTQVAKVMQSYASIITSKKIAERAASILGDNTINGSYIRSVTGVRYSEDSPILYISATDTNPERAISIANAVAEAFIIEVQSLTGSEGVKILDQATNAAALSLGILKYTVLGMVGGVIAVALLITVFVILSDRVYRVDDAELGGKLEVLGIILNKKGA